jgi:hypothetical protein
MATRPSAGNTSTPKFVPSVTITSALAAPSSNTTHSKPVNPLVRTIHLQVREFIVIYVETYLHRPATNLAVLDVRLVAAAKVEQNAD